MKQRILGVGLLAACLMSCQTDPSQKMVHHPFPDFSLPQAGSGELLRLSQLRGHPTLVVFWATWCSPCLDEVGQLHQLQARYQSRGLRIVGLSVDEIPAAVPLVVTKLAIAYPVATGALPLFDSLKLVSLPQSYLLDTNGVVVQSFTGAVPAAAFTTEIEKLLTGK